MWLLARLLSAGHLQGDRKYHCAFCNSIVDNTRQDELIRAHCHVMIICSYGSHDHMAYSGDVIAGTAAECRASARRQQISLRLLREQG